MENLLTLGDFCKTVPLSKPTARLYADSRLVPCIKDSRGRRLFRPEAVEVARRVLAERTNRSVSDAA